MHCKKIELARKYNMKDREREVDALAPQTSWILIKITVSFPFLKRRVYC